MAKHSLSAKVLAHRLLRCCLYELIDAPAVVRFTEVMALRQRVLNGDSRVGETLRFCVVLLCDDLLHHSLHVVLVLR